MIGMLGCGSNGCVKTGGKQSRAHEGPAQQLFGSETATYLLKRRFESSRNRTGMLSFDHRPIRTIRENDCSTEEDQAGRTEHHRRSRLVTFKSLRHILTTSVVKIGSTPVLPFHQVNSARERLRRLLAALGCES